MFLIQKWKKIRVGFMALLKIEYVLLVCLVLIYTVVLSYYSILRHNAFASGFDLGNMDQTVWNTLQGNFFSLSTQSGNMSRLAIHADFILVLLAPFYLIWENVRMLLIVESLAIGIGAVPVYLLAKKILNSVLYGFGFVALYLINAGLHWANMYDFHGVSIALPALLFCFYFAYIKNWKWYFITAGITLLTKETVSLTVVAIGAIVFFGFKEKKVGVITMAAGLIYFIVIVFIVMPQFSPEGKHWALSWFQFSEAEDLSQHIPASDFLNRRLVEDTGTHEYLYYLLRQWGFLPVVGLPFLFLTLPELGINILSAQGQMRSIYYHYDVVLAFGMIISSIYGVYYLKILALKFFNQSIAASLICWAVFGLGLFIAGRYSYYHTPLPIAPACWCSIYDVSDEARAFEKLLQRVPQHASITASPEIRPHVTHRRFSFTLPVATDSADFIAIIDQNRMVGNFDPKDFELRLIEILEEEERYTLVEKIGVFSLYKKK